MTMRGRFFTRSEYMQHVYSALVNLPAKIKTLPPAIVKSKEGPLWSGKQVKKAMRAKNLLSPFAMSKLRPNPNSDHFHDRGEPDSGGEASSDALQLGQDQAFTVREGTA